MQKLLNAIRGINSIAKPKLDQVDRKIIGILLEDSRKNFSGIGKELSLSKNAVWTRYDNLVKQGVINGATIQINYKKLGYDAVGTLLLDVETSQVNQISDYIKKRIPDVFGPWQAAARHNLRAVVTLKTISELTNIKEDLRRKLQVADIESTLWTDVWFTVENMTLIPVKPTSYVTEKVNTAKTPSVDETDLQIISCLAEDSRAAFRSIAEKVGTSTDTIARRYKRLKKEGIIKPRIQVDPAKIGYSAMINYYLRVKPGFDTNSIIHKIICVPDVFYVMKCTGDYNIGVIMASKDVTGIITVGEYLSSIEGLKRIETMISPFRFGWPGSRTYTSTL